MQCPQHQDALIPKPRGSLPKACAATMAAITVGGIMLQAPERLLTWVAMVVLILMLGCPSFLYEGGKLLSQVLQPCGLAGKTLLAAALAGLLLYVEGQPLPQEEFSKLLFLSSSLYALLKSLGFLRLSEVEVSDICEGRKMNVAHGLAWSFYLGYLQLKYLCVSPPGLEDSIAVFQVSHQVSCSSFGRGSRKLLILVPLNSNISHKLEDEDDKILFYDNLPNNEMDRAGVKGRAYKHGVYRADEHGRAHECVVEYAAASLFHRVCLVGLGFFFCFCDVQLEKLLWCTRKKEKKRKNRRNTGVIDEHVDDHHFLSKTILRHLQQQEREEFCLDPPKHQETTCPFVPHDHT
ncbi:LOW QUALITY PROTEIN: stimulator of interferon genes protein [Aulostomus maculatus]